MSQHYVEIRQCDERNKKDKWVFSLWKSALIPQNVADMNNMQLNAVPANLLPVFYDCINIVPLVFTYDRITY